MSYFRGEPYIWSDGENIHIWTNKKGEKAENYRRTLIMDGNLNLSLTETADYVFDNYSGTETTIHAVGTRGNSVTVYSAKVLPKELKKEITNKVRPHLVE